MLFAMPDPDRGLGAEVVDGFDAPAGSLAGWLVELPPGPQTLSWLASLASESLDAAERLLVLKAWERAHAWISAQLAAATVAVAGPEPTTRDDWVQDEVAACLRLSTRAAHNKVHLARVLIEEMPATFDLLEAGEITWRHAMAVVEECAGLDRAQAAAVQARCCPRRRPSRCRRSAAPCAARSSPPPPHTPRRRCSTPWPATSTCG